MLVRFTTTDLVYIYNTISHSNIHFLNIWHNSTTCLLAQHFLGAVPTPNDTLRALLSQIPNNTTHTHPPIWTPTLCGEVVRIENDMRFPLTLFFFVKQKNIYQNLLYHTSETSSPYKPVMCNPHRPNPPVCPPSTCVVYNTSLLLDPTPHPSIFNTNFLLKEAQSASYPPDTFFI